MYRQMYRAFLAVLLTFVAVPSVAVTIPDEVKKVVTFVFVRDAQGNLVPNGTGFFVGVKNENKPERMNGYLVTARHVLQDGAGRWYPTVWLRLNKLKGDAETVRLDLDVQGENRVFTHPDNQTVDIAVIPAMPKEDLFDFKVIPAEMIAGRESFGELHISEGSDVFFTGLFLPHFGEHKNYPIVRFGRVALISGERIVWKERDKPPTRLELYLIETQSFGGNSGSPVFFYLGTDRIPGALVVGAPLLKLAGIMKGSFDEGRMLELLQNTQVMTPLSRQNVGIAAVVPSYFLHDILFSQRLKELRVQSGK